jgi:hypothetical protein
MNMFKKWFLHKHMWKNVGDEYFLGWERIKEGFLTYINYSFWAQDQICVDKECQEERTIEKRRVIL